MYDSVNIYDGEDKGSPFLGRFCGIQSALTMESTSQYMLIEFMSDHSVVKKGFDLRYIAEGKDEGNDQILILQRIL